MRARLSNEDNIRPLLFKHIKTYLEQHSVVIGFSASGDLLEFLFLLENFKGGFNVGINYPHN